MKKVKKPGFLAIDLGAASGRVILGTISLEKISVKEIYRFPNKQIKIEEHLHWDIFFLFKEMKQGMAEASRITDIKLKGIGVDTWGVDFGLVSKDNQILGDPFTYRDPRTLGMMEKVFDLIPKKKLYDLTGIQFLPFNTIYQLYSMKNTDDERLKACDKLLFIPDLFNFLLTKKKYTEYTIASTSQLLNPFSRKWEPEIFKSLDLPQKILAPIIQPGDRVGTLLEDIAKEIGSEPLDVYAVASHDTASAVAAVPAESSSWAYLSSGTWSLLGVETEHPILSQRSFDSGFTNEGGVENKIRLLRNIMGLWLLQQCRNQWEKQGRTYSYEEMAGFAEQAVPFKSIVDPDDPSFLNPDDMPAAIRAYCKKTDQPEPSSDSEILRCIFESLALKYCYVLDKLNSLLKRPVEVLHIVGGGSQNHLLNQFTANAMGIPVIAGPKEATAIGNILIQAIAAGEINGIKTGRELVSRSISTKIYRPEDKKKWENVYNRVKPMFS